MSHQRVDLTEGNLLKGILTLAWPVIVANLLQTAYNIVDAFWLGKLGKEAFSAPLAGQTRQRGFLGSNNRLAGDIHWYFLCFRDFGGR